MSSFYSVLTNKSCDIQDNTLLRDIETHLFALLNARQFMLSTSHDYGLPDICADYTHHYTDRVISATRELIERYEPRIQIQKISCDNDRSAHNQINLRVIALVQKSTEIEFLAKLGSQRVNTVVLS